MTHPAVWLIPLIIVLMWARGRLRLQPLESDVTLYAVIGHELRMGRELYTDVWDHKPPAVYVTYALAEKITGFGWKSIYLLTVGGSILVLLGCYGAGTWGARDPWVGLWAALFWTVVSGDLLLEGNQPNTELFINACLIGVVCCWWSAGPPAIARRAILIGVLGALACLYKPVAALPLSAMNASLLICPPVGMTRKSIFLIGLLALGIFLITIAAVAGYFACFHRLSDFTGAVFEFSRYYVTQAPFYKGTLFSNVLASFSPGSFMRFLPAGCLKGLEFLLAVSCLGFFVGVASHRAWWVFWLSWSLATQAALGMPGYFFPHYFQLWLPVLCVGAALAIHECRRVTKKTGAIICAVAVSLGLFIVERHAYSLTPDDSSRLLWGDRFVQERDAGLYLSSVMNPADAFYQWGPATGLYFYSGKRPPSGVLWASHVAGPLKKTLESRLVADLERAKPAFLISSPRTIGDTPADSSVLAYARSHYVPLPKKLAGTFYLFARRDHAKPREQRP